MRAASVFVLFAVMSSILSCGPRQMPPEPSFEEHFGISVELPVPEPDFIELLNAQGISYEVSTTRRRPSPRNPEAVADASLTHEIAVYGDFDAELGRKADYRAYVEDSGDVVLIENAFSYVAVVGPCFFWCGD